MKNKLILELSSALNEYKIRDGKLLNDIDNFKSLSSENTKLNLDLNEFKRQ